MERWGYLKLTEKVFEFWNDPREDIYQNYARVKLENEIVAKFRNLV